MENVYEWISRAHRLVPPRSSARKVLHTATVSFASSTKMYCTAKATDMWMKKEAERVRHETGHLPLLRAIGDTSDEGRARTRCSACLRLTRTRFSVHHGHGMVVLAEAETKIVDELLCDAEEAVIVELELALDVVEDGPACLSLLGVCEGGDGRHGWRRR